MTRCKVITWSVRGSPMEALKSVRIRISLSTAAGVQSSGQFNTNVPALCNCSEEGSRASTVEGLSATQEFSVAYEFDIWWCSWSVRWKTCQGSRFSGISCMKCVLPGEQIMAVPRPFGHSLKSRSRTSCTLLELGNLRGPISPCVCRNRMSWSTIRS